MDYDKRTLKIGIVMKGKAIFHDSMTEVEIVDEGAGEYLKVTQNNEEADCGSIYIDPKEWKMIKGAIDEMVLECRDGNEQ